MKQVEGIHTSRVEVIGLGNPLMSDEGIGCRILADLARLWQSSNDAAGRMVQFRDLGTSGIHVLHAIAHQEIVFFIDCAFMGEPPGTIRRFTPEDITERRFTAKLSLHEGDLFQTLAISSWLGEHPKKVVIYGVEPLEVYPHEQLSPLLEDNLSYYLNLLLEELRSCVPVPHPVSASKIPLSD